MKTDERQFSQRYLKALTDLIPKVDADSITKAIEWLREAGDAGKTIYACGNGGSACIASQMVVDMVKGASLNRSPRFKMVSLGDNIATVMAYANDIDYESVFVEPLKNFAAPGDILVAISGSGNSPNVLRAVEYANEAGCRTIGLTTSMGGRLKEIVELPLTVPSNHMGRLEDCFFIITHILCYAFMEKAF